MLPTASFSTGKRQVPTGSILIASSWLGDSSTVAADAGELDVEFDPCDGFVFETRPHPDRRTAVAMAATIIVTVALWSNCSK
jgi:hypothetical protein